MATRDAVAAAAVDLARAAAEQDAPAGAVGDHLLAEGEEERIVIGFVLIGVGIGMHFPLGIGRAMRASLGQPDRAAGWTSAGIGAMSGIAPFLLAALADSWGVHQAFGVMIFFFAASFVLLLWKRVPESITE